MIHEALPTATETAFGSHPCCIVSVTYLRTQCFHGGNTGSNPVGDANILNGLPDSSFSARIFGHDEVTIEQKITARTVAAKMSLHRKVGSNLFAGTPSLPGKHPSFSNLRNTSAGARPHRSGSRILNKRLTSAPSTL